MLKIGDSAPEIETTDCFGTAFKLSDFRNKKRVVVFFFPKAFTPACTLEVRYFRDSHAHIESLGAHLVGVSVDSAEKNCRFAKEENLNFSLLADESKTISQRFGVVWPMIRIDRRATFLIGLNGIIEDVIHHEVLVYKHLEDVLARLTQNPK
jgi:thioredoxin-dependent peroxiredoxin